MSNITEQIKKKIGKNLHNNENHPLCIIKNHIYKFFDAQQIQFDKFDTFEPFVSIQDNFDSLLIPKDHPARGKTDTYYIDENTVLRTHTSAHQCQLMKQGLKNFLVTGDVYRKDEIDNCHYPVFHQMEGVRLVDFDSDVNPEEELKKILADLIQYLFNTAESEFKSDYFPFTHPSFEANVLYNNKWLEILGCGVVHTQILENNFGEKRYKGWAFGLGLERLAMILFKIPDIRLFWTDDIRFTNQFAKDKLNIFVPYPVLDMISKDISFWLGNRDDEIKLESDENFCWNYINDFYEIVREIFADNVAEVKLIDKVNNKKKKLYSHTFRITFTPNDNYFDCTNPAKFNEHCNEQMKILNDTVIEKLGATLR
jgi:phenylalanyl-tRNA synthetase alpha chain